MRIVLEADAEISPRITPPIQSSLIEEWFDMDAYELGVEPGVELGVEPESEPEPTTVVVQLGDPVIQKAQKSTVRVRVKLVRKYSKRHDI
jgi:hypothetical protein